MQLDMKNAFLQSKLDRVLYMYQPDYYNEGISRVCKLLKSLYKLKQSPVLWYFTLNAVLIGASWSKSKVVDAVYFKVGDDIGAYWVLDYVGDLLASSSSTAMLKEQKEIGAARDLAKAYIDKLRQRFIDEEMGGRISKMSVSVDAYAELTFDDKEAQTRDEEEYRQKVGSLQIAATTKRLDIAFACSKLGSSLTMRGDQHWREVKRHWHAVNYCIAYLADTRDAAMESGGGPESLCLVGYAESDNAKENQEPLQHKWLCFRLQQCRRLLDKPTIKCMALSSTELEYIVTTRGLGLKGNLKNME
ncbi:unnamed protein product [Closterium sp. NIES-54]